MCSGWCVKTSKSTFFRKRHLTKDCGTSVISVRAQSARWQTSVGRPVLRNEIRTSRASCNWCLIRSSCKPAWLLQPCTDLFSKRRFPGVRTQYATACRENSEIPRLCGGFPGYFCRDWSRLNGSEEIRWENQIGPSRSTKVLVSRPGGGYYRVKFITCMGGVVPPSGIQIPISH